MTWWFILHSNDYQDSMALFGAMVIISFTVLCIILGIGWIIDKIKNR